MKLSKNLYHIPFDSEIGNEINTFFNKANRIDKLIDVFVERLALDFGFYPMSNNIILEYDPAYISGALAAIHVAREVIDSHAITPDENVWFHFPSPNHPGYTCFMPNINESSQLMSAIEAKKLYGRSDYEFLPNTRYSLCSAAYPFQVMTYNFVKHKYPMLFAIYKSKHKDKRISSNTKFTVVKHYTLESDKFVTPSELAIRLHKEWKSLPRLSEQELFKDILQITTPVGAEPKDADELSVYSFIEDKENNRYIFNTYMVSNRLASYKV